MTYGQKDEPVYDLCSEGETPAAERQSKRHRKEEYRQKQSHVVDLSLDTPEGTPGVRRRSEQGLWGEVEGPPRWSSARRRSSLRHAEDLATPTPTTPLEQYCAGARQLRLGRLPPQADDPVSPSNNVLRSAHCQPQRQGWAPAATPLDDAVGRTRAGGARPGATATRYLEERETMLASHQAAARVVETEEWARQVHEAALARRMDELEELEAMEADVTGQHAMGWSSPHQLQRHQMQHLRSRHRHSAARPSEAAFDVVMGMLSEGGLSQMQLGPLSDHVAAVRQALGHIAGPGRLPAHLLFSDRDFDENDYEALLALDESVKSRKGASQEQINVIPTMVVGSGARRADGDCRCPICLEDFVAGALLRKMACKHHFHKACLDRWLAHRAVCPICQQSLASP